MGKILVLAFILWVGYVKYLKPAQHRQPVNSAETVMVLPPDGFQSTSPTEGADRQDPHASIGQGSGIQTGVVYRDYQVVAGDTLSEIGQTFGMTVSELVEINGLERTEILVGQSLRVRSIQKPVPTYVTPSFTIDPNNLMPTIQQQAEIDLDWVDEYLGWPYLYGGTDRYGIDCSSLVQRIFQERGVPLPRTSREQFSVGKAILMGELIPLDLVFFHTGPDPDVVTHVGVYLGNDEFIEADSFHGKVITAKLSDPYWKKNYIGARRVL
jgi:peptidoglycan DL-endopeptidase LytE